MERIEPTIKEPGTPSLVLPITVITVTLSLLLSLYVGAYYWLALNTETWLRIDGCPRLFAPIHWVDRQIRPSAWQSRE